MTTLIKFRSAGFRQILTSPGTRRAVNDQAYRISSRAKGTHVNSLIGSWGGGRAIAFVQTAAKSQVQAEEQREALESAVHGA